MKDKDKKTHRWVKLGEATLDENGEIVIETTKEQLEDAATVFAKAAKKRARACVLKSSHR